MEKEHDEELSNYDLRTTYLQTLKKFMAAKPGTSSSTTQANKEIDAYLGYEKLVSSHLQDLLDHEATRIVHR